MKKKISIVLVLAFIIGLIPGVAKAKLVACVGDSITYGWGIPDRNYNSYPAQLGRILRQFDRKWETQNFGVSSTTLLRNTNKPYVLENAYNSALASEPEVVIIMLGTNDSARATNSAIEQDFISDYLALIDAFAQLPSKPKIFICNPPPIFGGGYGSNSMIRDVIIPFIQQLPTYRAVEVIDLYTLLEESGHLFPDYLHPNAEGAKVMAEVIAATILGLRGHPDLNGDGIVDSADMCMMIDHWHTDNALYDIAPAPFGDGIVDIQDLIALAEYLFTYPGAVAYWKLDETEGDIAYDSVGVYDGILNDVPTWQPTSGMIDGALELDGIDDYVSTEFVLNPADGPFSVFAWIKGGAPGQAVLSQIGGVNWLCADTLEGSLMTELRYIGGRVDQPPLLSQTLITDAAWHRVGFVWDGSNRILYMDDIEVARDTQTNLATSENGLYIGAGKAMEAGSYWSGLIDDVRIYGRAISP